MLTEKQKRDRKSFLGCSELASVLGVAPFKNSTPINVWLSKTDDSYVPDFNEKAKERMKWGELLEDAVAKEVGERLNGKVTHCKKGFIDLRWKMIKGHIDRYIEIDGERYVLEVKTTSERMKKDWEDGVPEYYMVQVQAYLRLTGCKKVVVACLFGGQEMLYWIVEANAELQQFAFDFCGKWWNDYVVTKIQPPFDYDVLSEDTIKTLYPDSNGQIMEIEQDEVLLAYYRTNQEIAELEKLKEKLKVQVQAMMGMNEILLSPSYKVTWKTTYRDNLDTKKLKAELPEIAEKYIRQVSSRSFLVKTKKGGSENE